MEDVVSVIATALARPTTYVGHLREAMSLATCMVRYPLGFFDAPLVPTGAGSYIDRAVHPTPVLLVHGYGHNRSAWYVIERHLRNAGFANVYTVNYNPLGLSVGTLDAKMQVQEDVHMPMLLSSCVARAGTVKLEFAKSANGMGTLRALPQAGEERVPAAAQPHCPPMEPTVAGM